MEEKTCLQTFSIYYCRSRASLTDYILLYYINQIEFATNSHGKDDDDSDVGHNESDSNDETDGKATAAKWARVIYSQHTKN